MFWNTIYSVCLAAALAAPVFSQSAPAPPRPPRVHSIETRPFAKRGYLGVGIAELTSDRAKTLNLADDAGVEVKRVDENSPAAKAGLKENDVILEVNGHKVDDVEQFIGTISESAPGAKINLTVWSRGAKQTMTATLETRPVQVFGDDDLLAPLAQFPAIPDFSVLTGQSPRVGFEGETLTPQLAEYFGVKQGVLVRSVFEKTPAAKAGLKAGDVIVKISGTPVSSPREISGLVRSSHKTVTFTVVRNHKELTLNVELAEDRTSGSYREVM